MMMVTIQKIKVIIAHERTIFTAYSKIKPLTVGCKVVISITKRKNERIENSEALIEKRCFSTKLLSEVISTTTKAMSAQNSCIVRELILLDFSWFLT